MILGMFPGISMPPDIIKLINKKVRERVVISGVTSMAAIVALSNTAESILIQYSQAAESLEMVCWASGFKPSPKNTNAITNKYTFPARTAMLFTLCSSVAAASSFTPGAFLMVSARMALANKETKTTPPKIYHPKCSIKNQTAALCGSPESLDNTTVPNGSPIAVNTAPMPIE